jgi:hypothetical protein
MLLFTGTILLVPLGIIIPNVLEIRSTAHAIYSQYDFLEERNRLGYDIKKASRDYTEALPRIKELTSLSLPEGDELTFITATESLADKNGVSVTLNLLTDKAVKGKTGQLPFTLRVEGTFANVMGYIGALRTLPMATSINRINIGKKVTSTREQQSVTSNAVAVTMEGFVYRSPVATAN